ncbi:VOC family protein [Pusillimonas sp.]|uniref:VOC family protein n=1 Tax=Pusillimonas sp. TaxID=3040095 RepID=UPI0037C93DD8
MTIKRLDHYSVRTLDLDASLRFYTDIMGFKAGFRPPFDFPGHWLYNEEPYPTSNGVVHLIGIDPDNPEGLRKYLGDRDIDSMKGGGAVDHMAFLATDVSDMRARLEQHGLPWRERDVPSLSLLQLFLEDPSGITIELNYPASEGPARQSAQS